jgi:6,7-dimethyl-8-ribityllumazine synthase
MALDTIPPDLDGAELRIGVVQARFNAWAGEALLAACLRELEQLGVDEDDVTVLTVPGALEVPLALATLAANGDFDALIGLGCVIRGETYHFEIVAEQSAAGLARVALDHYVPVINGILTTENDEQARTRATEKGTEAARVAVEMANLLWALEDDGTQEAE